MRVRPTSTASSATQPDDALSAQSPQSLGTTTSCSSTTLRLLHLVHRLAHALARPLPHIAAYHQHLVFRLHLHLLLSIDPHHRRKVSFSTVPQPSRSTRSHPPSAGRPTKIRLSLSRQPQHKPRPRDLPHALRTKRTGRASRPPPLARLFLVRQRPNHAYPSPQRPTSVTRPLRARTTTSAPRRPA